MWTTLKIADYLIDPVGVTGSELLFDWRWLVPSTAIVLLVNRFAELVLALEDGRVAYLETSTGALTEVARDEAEFEIKLNSMENANEWLMIPLVDRCVAAGMRLGPNQCFGFITAPSLGGSYRIDNVAVSDIAEYLARMGQLHERIKDLPDGTPVFLD